ncbi:MAG: LytTR family DNA-binding domain-containing protein [Acetobacteraceae bacterium]|nr:LytTR family DNA-binding domain-containing protein [Acetobacteraceae bacterium]
MLRVVTVDDERASREAVGRLIARHPMLQLVGQATSAAAGVALIARLRPDAVFLDVQMAGMDGFRLLAQVPDPPMVVFVTAHAAYATHAFDVEAVDFLLKPVQPERFARTVRRLLKHRTMPATPSPEAPERPRLEAGRATLAVPILRGTRIVPIDDILAIQADGDDARMCLAGDEACLVRRSIGGLVPLLPAPPFLRVDRSLILHTGRIAGVEAINRDRTRVTLAGSATPLSLGRTGAATLRQFLRRAS